MGSDVPQPIVHNSTDLPGTSADLRNFHEFLLSDAGDVTFFASLQGASAGIVSGNDTGLWHRTSAGLELVALEGAVAPGTGGALFGADGFSTFKFLPLGGNFESNGAGQIAFRADLRHDANLGIDIDNDVSMWLSGSNGLEIVVREGDPAPDTGGAPFSSLGNPALNEAGQLAFFAGLDRDAPQVDLTNRLGLWTTLPGSPEPELFVRSGSLAPGANGARFDLGYSFGSRVPEFNASGQLAFISGLQLDANVTRENRAGVWESNEFGLELVARTGDPAPGLDDTPFNVFTEVQLNDRGDALVVGHVLEADGSQPVGLWGPTASGFGLIAIEGQEAPGSGGRVFTRIINSTINERGDIAFKSELSLAPGDADTISGLWAYAAGLDELILVSLEGDLVDLPSGRTDRIAGFTVATDFDGGDTDYLSNTGELFTNLGFTDGVNGITRSAFVSFQLPLVPEPTTLVPLDIKPGSFPNSVNLKSKGVLPVAILGTDDFDVNDVDIDTLLFGDPLLIDNGGTAVSPLRSALEDVSGDGLLDLTLKFRTADLVEHEALGPDTIEGLLTGETLDGIPFEGMDSIRIVPPNRSNGNSLLVSTVPEPSTLAFTALGLLGIGWRRRKRLEIRAAATSLGLWVA
ncbi:MAG: PEP-CTERM sorting domain-containing protein [Planctomycetes bacterium]|nr:PEP-CTERM sorting domain-containing protein [Planctomycetota bacterium]